MKYKNSCFLNEIYRLVVDKSLLKIPINTPILDKKEIMAVSDVLKNGSLTSSSNLGGKYVKIFEKKISSFVKSKYAIAVNSGTAALQASLHALDIKQGDEVIIPSFTFVATANAVVSVGAKPVFADIIKENYTMDPNDLQKKITKKTRAIILVHLYGNISYVEQIYEISRKYNIPVIEDSAQSLGSTYKGRYAGTFFDMGCFSMYPTKVMTSGEGGFVVTDNKILRDKLLMIRNHGMTYGNDTKVFGLNLRLPEINAAIATVQIKKLPDFLKTRKKNAKILSELLSNSEVMLPCPRKDENVNWYLYTVATKKRDVILKNLNTKKIESVAYYDVPIHKTPFYKSNTKLIVTDWAASQVLSLPIHPNVTQKDLELMAKTVCKAL